ncbi:hypothetical protein INV06_003035 [Listeria monocytogenes]|nr:hypothetical protein [Listeria monocytogenes]
MLTDDDRFKGKVVEVYQNSEGGYGTLSQRFSIPAFLTVHKWVKIAENREKNHYKNVGRNTITLPNSSIIVIHYYLNSKEFYLNAALRYGLSSGELLQRWHQKFLREDMEGTRNRRQSEKVR